MRYHAGNQDTRLRPLSNLSLEELVPKDKFYRHLEATVDVSFVRELVADRYAAMGRTSISEVTENRPMLDLL